MHIETSRSGDVYTMSPTGMLDASGGAVVDSTLQELIRSGASQVVLDMSGLTFLSSAGIRVLLTAFNQLKKLNGRFAVANPPAEIQNVLQMTGILKMLLVEPKAADPVQRGEAFEDARLRGVVHPLGSHELTGRLIGRPALLPSCGFHERDCVKVEVGKSVLGLGLGALGNQYADCQDRFGEFISALGVTISQPGDGSRVPDYLLPTGGLVPSIQMLYGLEARGQFSHFLRFELADGCEEVGLHEVAERVLQSDPARSPLLGFVMLAECEGLIGATLRESPPRSKLGTGENLFSFPGIRRRLAFSADPIHRETTVLVAGVMGRTCPAGHEEFLRPLDPEGRLVGHLHAAVFPYETLAAGNLDLADTLQGMFQRSQPEAVVHLLYDDRRPSGYSESHFTRGAVWFAPVRLNVDGA